MKTKQITKQMEEIIMNAHIPKIAGGVTYYRVSPVYMTSNPNFDKRDLTILSHNYEFEFHTLWDNPVDAEYYMLNNCQIGQGFNTRKARTRMFELDSGLWTVWKCEF